MFPHSTLLVREYCVVLPIIIFKKPTLACLQKRFNQSHQTVCLYIRSDGSFFPCMRTRVLSVAHVAGMHARCLYVGPQMPMEISY